MEDEGTTVEIARDGRIAIRRAAADGAVRVGGDWLRPGDVMTLRSGSAETQVEHGPHGWTELPWPPGPGSGVLSLRRGADDGRPQPIELVLDGPAQPGPGEIEVAWDADGHEGPFSVKVMDTDGATVAHWYVAGPRCRVARDVLRPGEDLRVYVRAHDGRDFVRHLATVRMRRSADPAGRIVVLDRFEAAVRHTFAALAAGRAPSPEARAELLGLHAADDGEAVARLLTEQLFELLPLVWAGKPDVRLGQVEPLRRACADDRARSVRETLAYLDGYRVLEAYFHECGLRGRSAVERPITPAHAQAMLGRLHAVRQAADEDLCAPVLLEAMVTSAMDRDAAAAGFALARRRDPAYFDLLLLDSGASTYLGGAALADAGTLRARRAEAGGSHRFLREPSPGAAPLMLFSCDPRFFENYVPQWLAVADYLEPLGIALHVAIVAGAEEAARLVAAATGIEREIRALRGAPAGGAVGYSHLPLPGWAPDVRTFSACARYLVAADVARRAGRAVLIADIDFVVMEPPEAFMASIPRDRVGFAPSHGMYLLSPWRRIQAGTFSLPADGSPVLDDVADYLVAGLPGDRTWMLDQNALDYAHERAAGRGEAGELADLGSRPTKRLPAMSLYERQQAARG